MGDDRPKGDAAHPPTMQCGGPCQLVYRRCLPPSSPLLTPFTMGSFNLAVRMVYAPLTRCRALGKQSFTSTQLIGTRSVMSHRPITDVFASKQHL